MVGESTTESRLCKTAYTKRYQRRCNSTVITKLRYYNQHGISNPTTTHSNRLPPEVRRNTSKLVMRNGRSGNWRGWSGGMNGVKSAPLHLTICPLYTPPTRCPWTQANEATCSCPLSLRPHAHCPSACRQDLSCCGNYHLLNIFTPPPISGSPPPFSANQRVRRNH